MMKNITILLFEFLAVSFVLWGCGGSAGNINNGGENTYYLMGGLVKNLDNDTISVAAYLEFDSEPLGTAIISLGDDTLEYDSSTAVYSILLSPASSLSPGGYYLKIKDSTRFVDSIQFTLPNDFQITDLQLPDTRINNGGNPVPMSWNISLNSTGYAYGVIIEDSAYIAAGYYEFVTTGVTSVTIPRDAFQLPGSINEIDTGLYHVYVYSYSGSPGSLYNLPTSLPSGFQDNYTRENFVGRFGSIVVTPRDSIRVAVE
nr:hypothetical protein [candidate division Zixibacteria bacterium]